LISKENSWKRFCIKTAPKRAKKLHSDLQKPVSQKEETGFCLKFFKILRQKQAEKPVSPFLETGFCCEIFKNFQQTVAKTLFNQIHKHLMIMYQGSTKLYQLEPQNESTKHKLTRDYILKDVDPLTKD
jgi:hypothetical protein